MAEEFSTKRIINLPDQSAYVNGDYVATDNATNGTKRFPVSGLVDAAMTGFASVYDATKTYAVGDFCVYGGTVYECTTAITTAEAWTAAHWKATTAGAEIANLKADFNQITKNVWEDRASFFESGYIITNVAVGTVVNTTRTASNVHVSAIVPCKKDDKFKLTGLGGNSNRLWAFTDTDYKLISRSINDLSATDLEITAPNNGYLIYNSFSTVSHDLSQEILAVNLPDEYTDILDDFPESVSKIAEAGGNWSSDHIPNYGEVSGWVDKASSFESGTITSNVAIGATVSTTREPNDAFMSAILPCKTGDVFKISGVGGNSVRLWAFTDTAYALISKSEGYITVTNLIIIAPANGYLIVNAGWETKQLYSGTYASISDYNPKLSELYALYDSLVTNHPGYVSKTDLGVDQSGEYHLYKYSFVPESITVDGADVFALPSMPKILLGSGTHGDGQDAGDQPEMVVGLYYFLKNMCDNWYGDDMLTYLRHHVQIELIPVQNPWGYVNKSRRNSRQVDINSNFPFGWTAGTPGTNIYGGTEPFSEAESVIIKNFIEDNLDAIFYLDLHTTGGSPTQDKMIYYSMAANKNLIVPANDTVVYLSDKWNHEEIANLDTTIMHGYIHSGGNLGRGEIYRWVNSVIGMPSCVMEAFPNFVNSGLSDNTELVMRMCQEELSTFIIKCIRYFKFNYLSNQRG